MNNSLGNSERNETIGFLYAFLAACSYACMATVAKMATEVPPFMMVFFRNFVCFSILAPSFFKKSCSFKTEKIGLFTFRAFLSYITLNCFYYATKRLFLMDSVVLINTSPLFIPIVVLIWDRIKIPKTRVIAITLGFTGILFILKPKFDFFNLAGLIGLGSGIFMAISMVTLRKLSKTEPAQRIMFYFFVGNMVLGLFPMLLFWQNFQNPWMWFYIFMVGVMSFLFQFFLTKAYIHMPPTRVSTISFSAVIISGFIGWFLWKNVPDMFALIGACLVIVGSLLVIREKKQQTTLVKD